MNKLYLGLITHSPTQQGCRRSQSLLRSYLQLSLVSARRPQPRSMAESLYNSQTSPVTVAEQVRGTRPHAQVPIIKGASPYVPCADHANNRVNRWQWEDNLTTTLANSDVTTVMTVFWEPLRSKHSWFGELWAITWAKWGEREPVSSPRVRISTTMWMQPIWRAPWTCL